MAGSSVLEIGLGTGGLAVRLAPRLGEGLLAGLDSSPLMVRQRRLERLGLPVSIDLRECTDRSLNWLPRTFSHIAALHSFQFWEAPRETLARLRGLLGPGGQLLLILRFHGNRAPARLPRPISRSGAELEGMLEALQEADFTAVAQHPPVGKSAVLTARRERA